VICIHTYIYVRAGRTYYVSTVSPCDPLSSVEIEGYKYVPSTVVKSDTKSQCTRLAPLDQEPELRLFREFGNAEDQAGS
jgi:hypothetical protein